VVGRASRSPPIYHPLAMLARAAPLTSQRRGVGLSDGVEEEKSIRRLFHFHFHFHFLIRLCNCCHSSCFAASCSGSHSSRVGNPLLVESLESRRSPDSAPRVLCSGINAFALHRRQPAALEFCCCGSRGVCVIFPVHPGTPGFTPSSSSSSSPSPATCSATQPAHSIPVGCCFAFDGTRFRGLLIFGPMSAGLLTSLPCFRCRSRIFVQMTHIIFPLHRAKVAGKLCL